MEKSLSPTPRILSRVTIRRHHYLALSVVMIAAMILRQVCGHDFLSYDDGINVFDNPYITNFSLETLRHFWNEPYKMLYIPLTYNVWGVLAKISLYFPGAEGALNPHVFHTANLLIHLASSLIVFYLVRALVKDDWGAWAGALLFAIHPIQVEAVAWVTGMKDVLSGFWSLLALWLYILYDRYPRDNDKRYVFYGFATVAFVCALLAKPSAVSVPLAAGVIGLFFLVRRIPDLFRELSLWVIIVIPLVLITKFAQPSSTLSFEPSFLQKFLVAGDTLSFYLFKLFVPYGLGPDYGRTPSYILGHQWVYLTGLLPYFLGGFLVWKGGKKWYLPAGLFLAFVLPVSGLLSFNFQNFSTVADRYIYVAMIGPSVGLGLLFSRYQTRKFLVMSVAFFLGLGLMSMGQVKYWQEDVAFYSHSLSVNPNSWFSYNNLGLKYLGLKEYDRAAESFKKAFSIKDDYDHAYNNLGVVYRELKEYDEAEKMFLKALSVRPNYSEAAANLGEVYKETGQFPKAIEFYERAIALNPGYSTVLANLGNIYTLMHRYVEAAGNYEEFLRRSPGSADIFSNLGLAYKALKQYDKAIAVFERASQLVPGLAEPYNNLGAIYQEIGDNAKALPQFEKAAEIITDNPVPAFNVAQTYLALGRYEEALSAYKNVLDRDEKFPRAYNGMSMAAYMLGEYPKAIEYADKAKELGFKDQQELEEALRPYRKEKGELKPDGGTKKIVDEVTEEQKKEP
ncbi:MAG: tetratricopeptide repeat protein [Proteobacteria bacterium]|nr:tetratricopeptide repeat protein [Pseudomonadota bacterium]MBU1685724.1 tetratricopeptide repeat protein [Pseudomonadota bacterium]